MKYTQKFVLVLGTLLLGVSGNVVSGQSAARHCTSEECACEEALQKNTVEALEAFLRKYPQSVNNGDSACGALAIPPGEELTVPEGQSHDDSGAPQEQAATPSEG